MVESSSVSASDQLRPTGRARSPRGQTLGARPRTGARASKRDGATTVAGTISIASRVGIDVMATGGLGGVHRDARDSFDESADLTALSRNQVLVVASGVKSILDIGATLERLDTLRRAGRGFSNGQVPRLLSK